jgi:hypothetical protein
MSIPTSTTLQAKIRAEGQRLLVSYEIKNSSTGEIGVFTRIPAVRADGTLDLSPSSIYVELADGTVELKRIILPLLEGLKVAERTAPLAAKLAQGQTFKEEFALPLPLPVCQPFQRAKLAATAPPPADVVASDPVQVSTVRLMIGVFALAGQELINLNPVSPAYPNVYRVWPPGVALSRQVVLTHETKLPAPIQVLNYKVVT